MAAYTILAIDDEQYVLSALRRFLKREGYHVIIADTGEYGIQCAREQSPDLVLLDISMPGMNGYKVMEKIREICDVPIVMLTGLSQLSEVLDVEDPPDTYIQKPADPGQLLSTLQYLLEPSPGL